MRALSEVIHDIAPRFGWSGDALGMLEANPEIAVAIAAGEIWSTTSMAKWIYKKGKSFVTPTKKRKKSAPPSQLPARRSSKGDMPFGNKRAREWEKEQDDLQKRFKSHNSMTTRPKGRYGLASKSKKFRKNKKPVYTGGKYVARNFDDYGTMEKDHCWYMGFQHHGSRQRLFDIIGEAVAKAMLARLKIYPRSYDETIVSYEYDTCTLCFTRVTQVGIDEDINVNKSVNGVTFKTLATSIADEIEIQANCATGTAPAADTVARYLHKINLWNIADGDKAYMEIKDIGESLISIKVNQKIRFQNITKNISGDYSLDKAGLNPLRGRKYVFANYRPNLIKSIQELDTTMDGFMWSDPSRTGPGPDNDAATGIMAVPVSGSFPKDHRLCHPPIAKDLFTNCKASTSITMPAGCQKYENTSFTMTHKMKTLIDRIYFAGFDKGAFGACTWFGFEKAYRQAKPADAADDDRIAVGFNREVHMYAKCTFKTQKSMLKHYDQSDLGLIAA